MASISITWHTMHDDRVCPVCKELDNYTWTFDVGSGQLNGRLEHPVYGTVWDMTIGSLAHGHKGNCRCNITYILDVQTLIEEVKSIRDRLLEAFPEGGMPQ